MNSDQYHIKFVNLAHRADRLAHMTDQLSRAGIVAERFDGIDWRSRRWDHKWNTMLNRTPGACGCHESQVSIMREALGDGKHAVVFEDDCVFCSDFQERFAHIQTWLDTHDWDVFYLGASVHVGPPWWHKTGHSHELPDCNCTLNRDAETTDDPHVLRCYGIFATFAYIVNKNSLSKVIDALEEIKPKSMGIDWSMIALGHKLKQFCFVPGCVRQYSNQSDIGNGVTNWDGFLKLNGTFENSAYVFQDKMTDLDPKTFAWKEAQR